MRTTTGLEQGDKVIVVDKQRSWIGNVAKFVGDDALGVRSINTGEIITFNVNFVIKYKKLSKRERMTLQGMKDGLKSRDIAKSIHKADGQSINEKTVSTYKMRCKFKMGLDNDDNDYITVVTGLQLNLIK